MRSILAALAIALCLSPGVAQEHPSAPAPRQVENLRAFAKLYGYARYFHPSDEAAEVDWEAFAAHGAVRARDASDDAHLRRVLVELFRPVAPTLRITTGDEPAPRLPELFPSDTAELEVVAWQHRGLGTGSASNAYRSVRTNRETTLTTGAADARASTTIRGPIFPEHPRPGDIIHEPLGANLTAHVPLALWSRDGRTFGESPPGELAALRADLSRVELAAVDASDEALRLADVIILWNVFQHFYPYWDVVDSDWDAVLTEALERALASEDAAPLLSTLQWMVHEIEDGHGLVVDPDERRVMPSFRVNWIEDQVVVVAAPEAAPVEVGDVIVAVDGEAATDLVRRDMATYSGSERWRRWRALMQFGLGSPGVVEVRLRRDGESQTVRVERQSRSPLPESRPGLIEELEPGIYYVDLGRASMDTIDSRMAELAGARGVIFDLRGYPAGNHDILRHLTDEPIQSAHFLVPRITRPDGGEPRDYQDARWKLEPAEPRIRGVVAFLTDERAISYAESVMGIVEHYELGAIVGGATAGANGNVNPITLPGGYQVRWTGMRVVKHDGSQHHLVGIQPTISVAPTIEGVRAGRDEVLERGLEVVRGRRR